MNFKEWFDSQTKIGYPCFMDYLSAQKGWDAAKQEIIKTLQDNQNIEWIPYNGEEKNMEDTRFDYIPVDVIDKIKNL